MFPAHCLRALGYLNNLVEAFNDHGNREKADPDPILLPTSTAALGISIRFEK